MAKTKKSPTKKPAEKKPKPAVGEKRMSALDAAARVLAERGAAMSCPELIEAMAVKGYWSSPAGKTPAATLYSAIQREVAVKGRESRFKRTAPGRFAAKAAAAKPSGDKPAAPAKAKPEKGGKGKKKAKSAIPDGTPGPESVAELFRI